MKRLIWEGGADFRFVDAPMPQQLMDGEVLIRPTVVGICGTDIHIMEGRLRIALPPVVLGHEIAGVVVEVGPLVDLVRIGDRVTIDQVIGCGKCIFCRKGSRQFCKKGFELGITADGGDQHFLVVPQENVFVLPASISDEAAAILDMEVWGALSKCGIERGESVVVIGPGPAGMVACQIARILGAGSVILAGPSGARMKAAENLGIADAYVRIDRVNTADDIAGKTGGLGADVAIECAGTSEAFTTAVTCVRPGGRVVLYGVHTREIESFDANSIILRDLVVFGSLSDRRGWHEVIELVSKGALRLDPLITHRFPFDDAPAAYDFVRRNSDGLIKAVIVL